MKKLKNHVKSSSNIFSNSITFTPQEILKLLSQIVELGEYDISLEEIEQDKVKFIIGNSSYLIEEINPMV